MSASRIVFGAFALALVSASGVVGAVPHPQLVRVEFSVREQVVRAADSIHIDQVIKSNYGNGKKRHSCCKRNRNTPLQ